VEKDGDSAGAAKAPPRRSLLEKIWWQASEQFGPAPAAALAPAQPAPIRDLLRRLPADFVLPAVPASIASGKAAMDEDENAVEFSWAGETARHVGTVVHRWLQRMAEDGLGGWDPARIASLKPSFEKDLARRGVPAADLALSADAVVNALTNSISDERGRWVLGPHPDARTEYRMRVFADGAFRTYVMDRVFRDAGKLWIVDYKTSRHEGADVEGFLDREQERYAAQLAAYATLFDEAKTGLYFPLLRGWRER
jgi:hypothetical protein